MVETVVKIGDGVIVVVPVAWTGFQMVIGIVIHTDVYELTVRVVVDVTTGRTLV